MNVKISRRASTAAGRRLSHAGYVFAFIALLASSPLLSAETGSCAACYGLTAWTPEDGLPPGNVLAITQDREGYLWLGTSDGLVRFDGFQFSLWGTRGESPLAGYGVPALIGARDGSLWVGYSDAGNITRIRGRELVTYTPEDGLPGGAATALLEDRTGAVWVGTARGLAVLQEGRWRRMADVDGLPAAEIASLYESRVGDLWVGTSQGTFVRSSGHGRFSRHDQSAFVQSFAESQDGSLWVADVRHVVKGLRPSTTPVLALGIRLPAAGFKLVSDDRGNLWVSALGRGLFRVSEQSLRTTPRIERFEYEHKFAGGVLGGARAIFQDRENNIWLGMRAGGLLRISESAVDSSTALEGMTYDGVRALAATPDGSVWISTFYNITRVRGDDRRVYTFPQTMALHTDQQGRIWAATSSGIGRFDDGRFDPLPLPRTVRLERVSSIAAAADGHLWICSVEQGLFRWKGGTLTRFENEPAVVGRPCSFVHADRAGRVWIAFTRGGAARFSGGTFRQYTSADGFPPGGGAAIHEDHLGQIWISTTTGVSRFRDDHLTTITARHGLPVPLVPSLLEDASGYLWIGVIAGSGVIRLDPAEVDTVAANSSHQIRYVLYDDTDGFKGPVLRLSRPTGVRSGDGRLWFSSGNGLAALDPAALPQERRVPTPRVQGIAVDGRELGPTSELVLPPNTINLRVDYSALDLSAASKLRFRYRLDGLNDAWVDAGRQRQASFMNLPPGTYQFRVGVTRNGNWNDTASALTLVIQPPFYRTRWFVFVCTTVALLGLCGAWGLRMRTVRKKFELVLAERARVSRDLHDTLLQSLAAVGLELEALAGEAESSSTSQAAALRGLRRQVGRCIAEARQSTSELRSPRLEILDLVQELQDFADDARLGTQVAIDVAVTGRHRRCAPETQEQLLRIGQEATSNALRHAEANTIRVLLDYRHDTLSLRVSDDGRGFDTTCQLDGEHWGLRNMRERAQRIDADFSITSQAGQGTTVEAIVPLERNDGGNAMA